MPAVLASNTSDIVVAVFAVLAFIVAVAASVISLIQGLIAREGMSLAFGELNESVKSRIDDRAPLVTVVKAARAAPFKWDEPLHRFSSRAVEVKPGERVALDDGQLHAAGWFWIDNEGRSTAEVTLPPTVIVAGNPSPSTVRENDAHLLPINTFIRRVQHDFPEDWQLRLHPNDRRLLYIYSGQRLDEWTADGFKPPIVHIEVRDTIDQGIRDSIDIKFKSPVIHDNPTDPRPWSVPEDVNNVTIRIERTRREYLSLPESPSPPRVRALLRQYVHW